MNISFKSLSIKQYLSFIILLLLATDAAILLDLPILRQTLGFLFFTIAPGLLVLLILKLYQLSFLKKFTLSVGLSIAVLMASALILNSFYPILSKPLSFIPILTCVNISTILLIILAFLRNRKVLEHIKIPNQQTEWPGRLLSLAVFSLLFPLMSVLGTYLMNSAGNNVILLVMLFAIPLYIVVLVMLKDKVSKATYPIALLMIGMALTLMYGLRGNNVLIGDVSIEIYTYHTVLANGHWNPLTLFDNFNACLPVTILPVVYRYLLNTDVYVYKLVYPLIHSVTPLVAYIVFRKYLDDRRAFLAAFLILSIFPYSPLLSAMVMRQIIGLLFFALAIYVMFDDEITAKNKNVLLGGVSTALIVSHYTTALIFAGLVFIYSLIDTLIKFRRGERPKQAVFIPIILLLFVFIFIWFTVITKAPFFQMVVTYTKQSISNLSHFTEMLKSQRLFLAGDNQITDKITLIFYLVPLFFIGIGVIRLFFNAIRRKITNFDRVYLGLMFVSVAILGITFIFNFYVAYDPYRMYLQFLIFIAPAFILGIELIGEYIWQLVVSFRQFVASILWIDDTGLREPAKNFMSTAMVLFTLIAQYFAGTYMVYQLGGVVYSEVLNNAGSRYDRNFIHDGELASADWLFYHDSNRLNVWGDYYGNFKYAQLDVKVSGYARMNIGDITGDNIPAIQRVHEGYIYLGYTNVVKGLIYPSPSEQENAPGVKIADMSYLFLGTDLIYNNGISQIYR